MATATITGNSVDIPDFALENTQEDILEKIGQMVSALGGVQSVSYTHLTLPTSDLV